MKIIHIIPSMNPILGGPAQGIRNYEFEMHNYDIERHIVCFDNPDEIVNWENNSLIIHALGKVDNPWQYHPQLYGWLKRQLPKFNVVIINGLWLYHSYATMKVIRELKNNAAPKVFIMPHGMLDPWFQKDPSRRLKAIRNEIYWRLIERQVVNTADGLLFTCEEELRLARTTFKGYHPKQEINVGYGIAPPPEHTSAMDIAFERKLPASISSYWLYLSRIHEKKGLDLLLNAYRQLWKEQTNLPDLVVAGPGIESTFGRKIAHLIASDELLTQHVHIVGMLTGDAKWGALYNCEAFVLPSHQENFGIAVVEALACGKPVLISNQVNIWREIKNEAAGLIFNDDLRSIYEGMRKFLLFNNQSQISKNAISCFENHFNIKSVVVTLINTLK